MAFEHTYDWLIQSDRRKDAIVGFNQPLTATHIARRTGQNLDATLQVLWALSLYGVVCCLNRDTHHNRIYWLTKLGLKCQERLRKQLGLKQLTHSIPDVPWNLYSSVCYSHRATIIKTMHGLMQPAEIKRKALAQNRSLRMSANNVRDVMRYLLRQGIVEKVKVRKKAHPRYELADMGMTFRELLHGAMARAV